MRSIAFHFGRNYVSGDVGEAGRVDAGGGTSGSAYNPWLAADRERHAVLCGNLCQRGRCIAYGFG